MSRVSIKYKGSVSTTETRVGETLLQLLQRNGIAVSAPCGGNGKCGNCKVNVVRDGKMETVLACKTPAEDGMTVIIEDKAAEICEGFRLSGGMYAPDGEGFGIAVDLGTTTVAAALIELSTGRVLGRRSAMNAQKAYGADVISRTQYTMDNADGLEILSETIRKQIDAMACELCNGAGIDRAGTKLFVAGNTIMQHIYAKLPPRSIAVAPFTPVTLFESGHEHCAPCVSGYIGGDITAGILATGLHNEKSKHLFVDLGTNGEMAIGSKAGIVCCSVASGPAFEGAGISCGMASTAGAINHIEYANGAFRYTTIGGAEACGICGSGIIELTACLVKLGIIDGSGYLQPPDDLDEDFGDILGEDDDGNGIVYITRDKRVYFTARDVRQIQLAKAAVAAGIDILMEEAAVEPDGIETLYLAGGFGTYIDIDCAALIGMLPEKLAARTQSVGNSSLAGAEMAISSERAREELFRIPAMCRYIELSNDKRFNDYFADHMAFYEED